MDENEIAASIEAHRSRNEALQERFAQHGVSGGDALNAEVHFWAPNQRAAALLARELYSKGYLVLMLNRVADGEGRWNVDAGRKAQLSEMLSTSVTEDLVRTAARFDATYDGWGASVPSKGSAQSPGRSGPDPS